MVTIFVFVDKNVAFDLTGMKIFRIFADLRGHCRGNPRSGLIFMGGGGYHKLCVLGTRVL